VADLDGILAQFEAHPVYRAPADHPSLRVWTVRWGWIGEVGLHDEGYYLARIRHVTGKQQRSP